MTSTSPSSSPTRNRSNFFERLAWPGVAAVLTVVSWILFILTETNLWLLIAINVLMLVAIISAGRYHKRLLLTLLSGVLLIHGSFYALYTWPIPNLLIGILLLIGLSIVWHATMGSRFGATDVAGLLAAIILAWIATAYLPTNLVNATTLASLPLFVLLPAVYHRRFNLSWLFGSFSLCSVAAIVIIQTAVLFSP